MLKENGCLVKYKLVTDIKCCFWITAVIILVSLFFQTI